MQTDTTGLVLTLSFHKCVTEGAADLLVSMELRAEACCCSTSTLREAIALTVSASSSDWPCAALGASDSEWALVRDKLWRQGQCLPWRTETCGGWFELSFITANHFCVRVCISYSESQLLSPVRPKPSDMASPEATEALSQTKKVNSTLIFVQLHICPATSSRGSGWLHILCPVCAKKISTGHQWLFPWLLREGRHISLADILTVSPSLPAEQKHRLRMRRRWQWGHGRPPAP